MVTIAVSDKGMNFDSIPHKAATSFYTTGRCSLKKRVISTDNK